MSKIITVSGHAQNGKDTFALFAKEFYENKNKKCIIFHYADFLKFICKQYFGWSGAKDEIGRTLLQQVGTEIFRNNNKNCWVNMAKEFVSGLGSCVDYVIIPDARFPNEIECWRTVGNEENIISVRVERPNFDNGLTAEQNKHESEVALDRYIFDYELYNDGDLNDYKNHVFDLLGRIEF